MSRFPVSVKRGLIQLYHMTCIYHCMSFHSVKCLNSLRKQPTFRDATTNFPAKCHLRKERRNSTLMTRHYPDLVSASNWSCRVGNLFQLIRSTTQIWVMTRHQYMKLVFQGPRKQGTRHLLQNFCIFFFL